MAGRRGLVIRILLTLAAAALLLAVPAQAGKLNLPAEATEGLRILYNGNPDAALPLFQKIQREQPDQPLGFLLEAEARWWKIYCQSLEIKWNLIDAWRHSRSVEDDEYLSLAEKTTQLAEAQLAKNESPQMHFYAGMGLMLRARLLGLRDDRRGTARAGVKAREHFLRATALDPDLADAYAGLGLYNYYVDTLSGFAKILRFFMGIPGGSKHVGMQQLERAMKDGELTGVEARFYLGKNLRNYDQQYERAAEVLAPLAEQYPQNPLFPLLIGDMNAKLNRKEKAAAAFHAAENLSARDPGCAKRLTEVIRAALVALGGK
jgi:tetratricopeptide (TPR) repeat protein